MSETAFEHDFLATPDVSTPDVSTPLPQPLRARPQGVRAALGMGGAASVILLATMAFVTPRHDGEQASEQRAPAEARLAAQAPSAAPATPAPAKISTKAEKISTDMPAPPPAGVALPFSAFDLAAPELAQEKKTIGVRDGDDGAGRVDAITIGQFEAAATFVRVDVHQNATEKEADADFFLDMTRHATRLGLNVAKIGAPGALRTRFGDFEAADIRLTQPAAEGGVASERNCLAARLLDPKASLVVASLACGSSTLPIDRAAFGCLLDHLAYKADAGKSDANSPTLGDFFQKAAAPGAAACNAAGDVETTASIPARSRAHTAHASHGRRRHHR